MSHDPHEPKRVLDYVPVVPEASSVGSPGEFLAICFATTFIVLIYRAGNARATAKSDAEFISGFAVFVLAFLVVPFLPPMRRVTCCLIALATGLLAWVPGALVSR